VDVEFAVESPHAPGIEKNQNDKRVNRTLLSKPEAELIAPKPDGIEWFNKNDAENKGNDEPCRQAEKHQP